MILLFLTRSFKDKEFEEKSGVPLDLSREMTQGFPFVFHSLFHPSIEQQLG